MACLVCLDTGLGHSLTLGHRLLGRLPLVGAPGEAVSISLVLHGARVTRDTSDPAWLRPVTGAVSSLMTVADMVHITLG